MPFCPHAMNCFDNSQIIFSAIDHQDRVEKVELKYRLLRVLIMSSITG
jgi:hypothetical protein